MKSESNRDILTIIRIFVVDGSIKVTLFNKTHLSGFRYHLEQNRIKTQKGFKVKIPEEQCHHHIPDVGTNFIPKNFAGVSRGAVNKSVCKTIVSSTNILEENKPLNVTFSCISDDRPQKYEPSSRFYSALALFLFDSLNLLKWFRFFAGVIELSSVLCSFHIKVRYDFAFSIK